MIKVPGWVRDKLFHLMDGDWMGHKSGFYKDSNGELTSLVSTPLSPSAMTWDLQGAYHELGGCHVRRILKKNFGWRPRGTIYMFRGKVIDDVITVNLQQKVFSGTDISEDAALDALHQSFKKNVESDDFDLPDGDELEAYKSKLTGVVLAIFRGIMPGIQPRSSQEEHMLMRPSHFSNGCRCQADKPNKRSNCVLATGFSDWTFNLPEGGVGVNDLKCLSRILSPSNGRYRLQVNTYGAALRQKGVDVRRVGLLQISDKKFEWDDQCQWDFGDRDVQDTINVYTAYESSFLVPLRGVEICSPIGCPLFDSCPVNGNGKPWTGKVQKDYAV